MKKFIVKASYQGFILLLVFAWLSVGAQVKLTDPIPVAPKIKIGKLANGNRRVISMAFTGETFQPSVKNKLITISS